MATKKPDILFTAGLSTTKADASSMYNDLQELIEKVEEKEPKIRVGLTVSAKALENFRKQIQTILNSVSTDKGTPIKVSISGIGEFAAEADSASKAAKKAASDTKNLGTSIKPVLDMYKQMHKLLRQNKDANDQTSRSYKGLTAQTELFRNALKLAYDEQITIDDALKRMGVDTQTALRNASEAISKFGAEMEHTGRSGTVSAERLYKTVSRIQDVLGKNKFASDLGVYKELQDQFIGWENAAEAVRSGIMTVEEALESLGESGQSSSAKISKISEDLAYLEEQSKVKGLKIADQDAIKSEKDAFNTAIKAAEEYYKWLKKLKTTDNDVIRKDGLFVSPSGNSKQLASDLNRSLDAFKKISAIRKGLTTEHQASLTNTLTEESNKYKRALEDRANAARKATQVENERIANAAANKAAIKAETEAYSESERAIKDYYKYLKQLKTTENDVKLVDGLYVSEKGNDTSLADNLNRTAEAYAKVKALSGSLNADDQAALLRRVNEEQRVYNDAVAEYVKKLREAQAAEDKQNKDALYDKSIKAVKDYYSLLTQVKRSGADITLKDGHYASESGYYRHLAADLDDYRAAFIEAYKARAKFSNEQIIGFNKTYNDSVRAMNRALEEQANAERKSTQAAKERQAQQEKVKNQKSAYDEAIEIVKRYHKELAALKTTENDIQRQGRIYTSASGRFDIQVKDLNEAKAAYSEIWKLRSRMSSDQWASVQSTINQEQREYNRILEKQANTEHNVTQAAKERTANIEANKAAIKAESEAYTESKKAVEEYYKYLKDFRTTKHDVKLIDGQYVSESNEYADLADNLNRTAVAYSKVRELSTSLSTDNQAALLRVVNEEQRSYNNALADYTRKMHDAQVAEDNQNKEDIYKKSIADVKKYYELLTEVKRSGADISLQDGHYVSESGYYRHLAADLDDYRASFIKAFKARSQFSDEQVIGFNKVYNDSIRAMNRALEEQENAERKAVQASKDRQDQQEKVKSQKSAYDEAIQIVSRYHNELIKLKTTENDIQRQGRIYTSASGRYAVQVKDLNEAKAAYLEIGKLRSQMSSDQWANVQEAINREQREYNRALEEQANAERKAAQAGADRLLNISKRMSALLNSNKNASSLETYEDLKKFVADFNKNIYDSENRMLSAEEIVARFGDTAAKSIAEAEIRMAALNAEMEETGKIGNTTEREVIDLITKMKTALNMPGAGGATGKSGLETEIASLETVLKSVTGGASVSQAFEMIYGSGKTTAEILEELRTKLAAFRKEIAGAIDTEALYYKQMSQLNSVLTSTKDKLDKWTASKYGTTSGEYDNIEKAYAKLSLISEEVSKGEGLEKYINEITNLTQAISNSSAKIKIAGEDTQSWIDRLNSLVDKFGSWLSISQAVMYAVNSVKKMVSTVIDLDGAMTELKKVTNETDAIYNSFLDKAAQRAKVLGATMKDVVSSTASFARLGYSIDEASKIADAAIIYKNVGDGIDDINTASESIISTMQAFGIEATNVMSIVDKFNLVGNNFAISSGGIGDALMNSAAALSAANNSLDEGIALITAANKVIQNPERVGTAMKTLSMYLRAAKTEAEEAGISTEGMASSVSELRGELKRLTGGKVDIMDMNGDFKSTYDIIRELSNVWDSLSDTTQSNITEIIGGGVRNANVISALMNNFSEAEKVFKKTAESSGSALKENEVYLESIQGRISQFQAAFESLSTTVVNSGLIKFVVSAGADLITGLDLIIDKLGSISLLVGGINFLSILPKLKPVQQAFNTLAGGA